MAYSILWRSAASASASHCVAIRNHGGEGMLAFFSAAGSADERLRVITMRSMVFQFGPISMISCSSHNSSKATISVS
jgi:hypothetical protein